MRFGKNKGCEFIQKNCLDSYYNTQFENEFFDYNERYTPSCSAGRQSRTYAILNIYNYIMDNTYWYNFIYDNSGIYYSGSMYTTDYCPTHGQRIDEKIMGISLEIVNMEMEVLDIIFIILILKQVNMNQNTQIQNYHKN